MKKIAILGNMNNNGASLLRYFRDEGYEAFLFPFFNDGKGSLEHFLPENESSDSREWLNYIRYSEISNWPHQLLPLFFAKLYLYIYICLKKVTNGNILLSYSTPEKIRALVHGFDTVITSGYGAAILWRAGIHNFVYFPYCIGIEGVERTFAPPWRRLISRLSFEFARPLQIAGLRRAIKVFLIDNLAGYNAVKYKIDHKFKLFPIVYVPKKIASPMTNYPKEILNRLNGYSLKVFSFSRIIYTNKSLKKYGEISKNNDWILTCLKKCVSRVEEIPSIKFLIVEYGPDVQSFKESASELGLSSYFEWIPIQNKTNLFALMSGIDVCFGEFIQNTKTLFGSAGWEAIAHSKPLVNSFNYEFGEFEELFGLPEIPMVKIRTENDLEDFFYSAITGRVNLQEIGKEAKVWFNSYNSHALAREWIKEISP
jgi:hypothetical protein